MEARRLVEDLSRSLGAISSHGAAQSGDSANDRLSQASPDLVSAGSASQPQQLMLATGSLLSSALFEEKQRQLQYWRRRLELFMQMRYGFEKISEYFLFFFFGLIHLRTNYICMLLFD